MLSLLFRDDCISHAAFPIIPGGTGSSRQDLGPSGGLGRIKIRNLMLILVISVSPEAKSTTI